MVTTIQLSEELKQKISSLKRKDSETYEQVIARLVDKQEYEFKLKEHYRKYGTEISPEDKAWMELDMSLVESKDYEKKNASHKKK
jgi:predicted transcriptional regulator